MTSCWHNTQVAAWYHAIKKWTPSCYKSRHTMTCRPLKNKIDALLSSTFNSTELLDELQASIQLTTTDVSYDVSLLLPFTPLISLRFAAVTTHWPQGFQYWDESTIGSTVGMSTRVVGANRSTCCCGRWKRGRSGNNNNKAIKRKRQRQNIQY